MCDGEGGGWTECFMDHIISQRKLVEKILSNLLSRLGGNRKIDSVMPSAAPSHAPVYTIGASTPAMVTRAISYSPGAQNHAAGHVLTCSFALSGAKVCTSGPKSLRT